MKVLVSGVFESSSQKAHAINTVKMAQGFARCENEVTLICRRPPAGPLPEQEFFSRYSVTEPMRLVQLPNITGEYWRYALACLPEIQRFRPDFVYARNYILPWLTSRLGIATVAESHAHPDNKSRPFLRLVNGSQHEAFRSWVTISKHLADHYHSLGVPKTKLLILPDAVDLQMFLRPAKLPPSPFVSAPPHVVYAGHLYDYKGIPTILGAASHLPEVQFHLVGGLDGDIDRQRRRVAEMGLKNVTLHGHVPHSSIPRYLWNADILLLPPSSKHPSAKWTSPVKMGEYLASGVPIIASGIPALRDFLTHDEVMFVRPDDPFDLARAVKAILVSPGAKEKMIKAARRRAEELSYNHRARKVLRHVNILHNSRI